MAVGRSNMTISIGSKKIGDGQPVYVIAEAGVNHNGDARTAREMIAAASDAGADAVKFQTFTPDEIVTEHAAQADYQRDNTGIAESQADMLKRLTLSHEDFRALKQYADFLGIEFLSTPFSIPDADFLHELGVSALKVSSGDLTNLPFLEHIARYGKPILLSTGMATMPEIREAFDTLRTCGAREIVVLQCTSEYPAPLSHINLRVLDVFKAEFDAPVGFSDHTLGIEASLYATQRGAAVIEKHFTLDTRMPGPDHAASLEPDELRKMIIEIRARKAITVPEEALGSSEKQPSEEERRVAKQVRKGLAARVDIVAGEILTEKNMFIARPEGEIRPRSWNDVLGKKAKRPVSSGTSLTWDMLEV